MRLIATAVLCVVTTACGPCGDAGAPALPEPQNLEAHRLAAKIPSNWVPFHPHGDLRVADAFVGCYEFVFDDRAQRPPGWPATLRVQLTPRTTERPIPGNFEAVTRPPVEPPMQWRRTTPFTSNLFWRCSGCDFASVDIVIESGVHGLRSGGGRPFVASMRHWACESLEEEREATSQ